VENVKYIKYEAIRVQNTLKTSFDFVIKY